MTELLSLQADKPDVLSMSPHKHLLLLAPKLLIILSGVLAVVDGVLPQAEMAATGGSLLFTPKYPLLLLLGLASMVLLRQRFQSSALNPLTLGLLAYFLFDAFFLHFSKDLSFTSVRHSLDYFILLIVAVAASGVPLQISERHILASFVIVTLACLTLSALQFFTNTPVVRTESIDYAFHVESIKFFGKVRCFSFCATGLQAGIFYSFMGAVAASFCLQRGSRIGGCLLLSLCALGCYATYTRLVMIGFVLGVVMVFMTSRKEFSRVARFLPVFSFCCAALVIAQGIYSSAGAGRKDLASSSSLDQRLLEWGIYSAKFLDGSPADILFGVGLAPYTPYSTPDRPENAAAVPLDNAYLLVLLSSGVCGLIVCGLAYWVLWIHLCRLARSSRSHLLRGISGMFAIVPFLGAINDPPTQIIVLLLLALSLDQRDHGAFLRRGSNQRQFLWA